MPGAVEELLRYTSPVSLSDEHWASEDVERYGKLICIRREAPADHRHDSGNNHQYVLCIRIAAGEHQQMIPLSGV
jgi:hypothetical protein